LQASGAWSGTVAAEIVRGAGEAQAGTIALWLSVADDDRRTLDEGGIAVFDQIDLPLRALSHAAGWSPRRDAGIVPEVDPTIDVRAASALLDGAPSGTLDEADAKDLLIVAGVPHVVRPDVARTDEDLIEIARHAHFPLAVKILSRSIVHKGAVGGVVLNVCSPADLTRARDQVLDACRQLDQHGVLIEPMAPPGIEVFIGAMWDPELGPVALVGRGGTGVERADDLAVAPAPLDEVAATELLARTEVGAALRKGDADVEALVRVISKVTSLFVALDGRVREMDVNPVIVHPKGQGVSIVDCLVVPQPATTRS
jgi:acyl-CoA synthetase (NDP forming)